MADTRNIRLNIDVDGDDRGVKKVAKGLDDTAKSADKAGKSLRGMGIDAKQLNIEIAQSNRRIAELRRQLVEVGNDKGVRKALRGEESWLRELTKIGVAAGGTGAGIAVQGGGSTAGSSGGAFAGTPVGAVVVGGLVALAAAAAPAIGGMVAGAVAGVIGTGGIAGGIAMASKDSRVRNAASEFGDSISKEFFRGGGVFVGPTIGALRELESAFKDMKVPETFAKMAPHVETIAKGFGDLGRNIMPGLNAAFDRMGPFAAAASHGLAETGKALGIFMDRVTASEGTITGLNYLFKAVNNTIIATGNILNALADTFDALVKFSAGVSGALEDIPGVGRLWDQWNDFFEGLLNRWPALAGAVVAGTNAINEANKGAAKGWDEYRAKIEGVNKAMSDNFDIAMNVDQANLAVAAGLAAVNEAFKENKGEWDTSTEAGRRNNEVLLRQIENLNGQREANIAAGQDAKTANANFDTQLQTLLRLAGAAGATKQQLDALARTYMINVRVNISGLSNIDKVDFRRGFAHGGTTPGDGSPFWVGEKGPELMFDNRSHFVATASQSQALATGGGAIRVIIEDRSSGGVRARAIQEGLNRGVPAHILEQAYP